MVRRVESFIRTSAWRQLRQVAWQRFCKRIEVLYATGIKRLNSLTINVALVRNRSLTARAIGVYAIRKLLAQNRLGPIFKPITRYLGYCFAGIKFSCKGRFTRRQRASLTVFSRGSVKLSTFTSDIDYNYVHIPLKFGVGCIKMWINRGFRAKNRISNSLTFQAKYTPRKSKTIGLTETQRLRFTFGPTPRLIKMASQLKAALIPVTARKRKLGVKQLHHTQSKNEFASTTPKTFLYKYARYKATNSQNYLIRELQNTSQYTDNNDLKARRLCLTKYLHAYKNMKHDSKTYRYNYNLFTSYVTYRHVKQLLLQNIHPKARLFKVKAIERTIERLLNTCIYK
jgi:hypothetical protein